VHSEVCGGASAHVETRTSMPRMPRERLQPPPFQRARRSGGSPLRPLQGWQIRQRL